MYISSLDFTIDSIDVPARCRRPAILGLINTVIKVTRRLGGEIQAVVVVSAESGVTLRTLPLSCLVARAQTVPAENVEALCEDSVFAFHLEKKRNYQTSDHQREFALLRSRSFAFGGISFLQSQCYKPVSVIVIPVIDVILHYPIYKNVYIS